MALPKKSDTAPAVDLTDPRQGRAAITYFPGIAERDVVLVERLAEDFAALAKAFRAGDAKAIATIHPRLRKLTMELERLRRAVRVAMSRPSEE